MCGLFFYLCIGLLLGHGRRNKAWLAWKDMTIQIQRGNRITYIRDSNKAFCLVFQDWAFNQTGKEECNSTLHGHGRGHRCNRHWRHRNSKRTITDTSGWARAAGRLSTWNTSTRGALLGEGLRIFPRFACWFHLGKKKIWTSFAHLNNTKITSAQKKGVS